MRDGRRDNPSMADPNAPSREALERRIVDLEVRAAFQTQTIELLDEVVREFAGRVESLERALGELRMQLNSAAWADAIPLVPEDGSGGVGDVD